MALEFLDDVDDDFKGREWRRHSPLMCSFFFFPFFLIDFSFFSFNSEIKKEKEKENSVVLVTLMATHNWGLIESCIDKNWNLEN